MQTLKRIHLAGWKSIKDQTIGLQPLTVIIGANGAGKSNLISLFRLLNATFAKTPGFRNYVGISGGASELLHFGAKQTPVAELELVFGTDTGDTTYRARWAAAASESLIFIDEKVEFWRTGENRPQTLNLGAGHSESKLAEAADAGDSCARVALHLLRSCRLFHFHDTSDNSPIRSASYLDANRFLSPDAANLASMLYLFQEMEPVAFRRISATVRQMIPDFGEFVLEPRKLNEKQILLKWKQKGRDYEFGPHQVSDGSIRFIALAALLLQPTSSFPLLVALDEPELGLHPSALEILAGMAKAAGQHCQIVLATQSPVFLDHFEAGDVVVASCRSGASEFERLSQEGLNEWLANYTLSEIWEKNVIGGGPYG